MKKILKIDNPNTYADYVEAPVLHPLVSIINYDEVSPFRHSLNNYGVYGLFIQQEFPKILSYGMKMLQVSDASIIAVAPGQVGGLEDNGERLSLSGWVLMWSPELLHNSFLEARMKDYQYFLLRHRSAQDGIQRVDIDHSAHRPVEAGTHEP